ncbi:Gfo/Idh/MocA family protein [Paenibacillus ginsengarvi]|uniref:Gfo/Idh/MocA family oxidoreductase n=1 Tax=Paenibacillus ginsengarvi TaxID=400777 RepID=A0A3B0C712_9BACL|nr:Gfo/Idh/MocA family oxidoreductase [Paenibacillus ginsengarvi]RKN79197.1 gfo/Idh/MocA family oxidoreductase [Paenibacillus ginsengarvi]
MGPKESLKVGIVGAAGRPRIFAQALADHPRAAVAAICDVTEERLQQAATYFGSCPAFLSFESMLEETELDAVIIGTPMQFHVEQSLLALEHDLHVISEVPAGISLEECRQLTAAAARSKGQYIMAENCNYMKPHMMIANMARSGLFGELYYAEGEYLHEVKELNERTPWRRQWQTGINGITYGTHSIGPILDWMDGDRIAKVSCIGSGHHYTDSLNRPYAIEDTCVMTAKTERGRLIKIRLDMLSERPGALNYELQGTRGCYESIRYELLGGGKVYLKREGEQKHEWTDLSVAGKEYIPDIWHRLPESMLGSSGHGGSDYVMMTDFLNALTENKPSPISIHKALDMTLPGLISQLSIERGGEWLNVPDSRAWI